MKRIKLLLAAVAALVGMSAHAQTDAQYDAALAAITDGAKYSIIAEYKSGTYYLKTNGYLTEDLADAGVFTFTAATIDGFKPTGFKSGKFTNGGDYSNNFSGDNLKRIATNASNRNDWEAQVYFLNEEGYYAIRSTNAVSSNWGAGAYWTVVDDNDEDLLPNATYTVDDVPFIWKLQDRTVEFAKKDLADLIAEAEGLGVSTTDATAVYVDATATIDDVNAAIFALKTDMVKSKLVGADAANPVDATFVITNPAPGISGNVDGWVNSNSPGLEYQLYEYWNVSGGTTKQTLSALPKGTYKLTVIAYTRDNMTAYLHAGENQMAIVGVSSSVVNNRNGGNNWIAQGNGVNELFFTLDEDTPSLEIGLTADNTTGDHWMCWRSFTLTFYGDATEGEIVLAEAVAAGNAQATSLDGKIPAAALAALNTAVTDNNKAYETVEEYKAAATAINDAVDYANTLVYPYTHYKIVSTAAAALDDDTDMYTGDATIDVSAADADAEAATDEAGLNAAILKVQEVVNAFLDAVNLNSGYRFDITNIYLENADFNRDYVTPIPGKLSMPKGWEITITGQNCGQQNRTDTNPETSLAITDFIEAWHPSQLGSGVIAQTVKVLPEGTYVLEADASVCHDPAGADDIVGASLFIKSSLKTERQAISNVRLYINHYSLSFAHGGDGEVQFGLENDNSNANWLSADNFKVYYAGPMPLSMYDDLLAEALVAVQDYDKEVPQAALEALQDVADENDKAWSSKDEYRAAIKAINDAVEATDKLVAPYAEYKAYKPVIAELTSVEGYTETVSGATSTFEDALAAADKAVEASTDVAGVKAQIEALNTVAKTFLAGVRSDGEHPFDLTFMIVNPGFDDNNIDGWTRTYNGGSANTSYHNNEFFDNNSFDFYQTLTDMPKGNYELKVQAFQRPGDAGSVYNAYIGGNTSTDAVVYINDGETAVKHIAAEAQDAPLLGEPGDGWPADSQVGKEGAYKYFPNSMEGAEKWFGAGFYDNSILTAGEGTLKIGFKADKKTAGGTWTLFDNFRLYYYGQSINVAMDEKVAFAALADIEGANVTMARTTVVGYNTVALPFDLTEAQTKAVFGDDAVVYAYSEESEDAANATVSFKTADTKIEANVPVLVKATKAVTEIKVDNVTVKAGAAKVEGTNFDFVGNYEGVVTIADGDWFIGNGAVYESEGATTIAGFRAYIKDVTGSATVRIYIDGVETAISEINGGVAENAAIYNLAGQRVQKAQRGLYIIGGKKYLVK